MKDVAKKANVSIATVSNYINGTKAVSEKNAERISNAIENLNYIPNQIARNLKSEKTKNIAVILPNIYDNYYQQIFESIQRFFTDKSFGVTIATTNDIKELEKKYIDEFLEKKVAGFILVTCNSQDKELFYGKFLRNHIPIVLLDRFVDIENISYLGFKNDKAIYDLVSYFLQKGKSKICILAGSESFSCETKAVSGYRKALEEYHIVVNSEDIIRTNLTKEAGFRSCLMYLQKKKPDVIITTSHSVTLGVMESLLVMGYHIPKDISIATLGEDNWDKLNNFQHVISTSRQSFFLGTKAAQILYSQIQTPKLAIQQYIEYEDKFEPSYEPAFPGILKRESVLKAAMLDSPQVDLFECLIPLFTNKYKISVTIEKISHDIMFDYITKNYHNLDIIMYDMPWLFSLAEKNILKDITKELKEPYFDSSLYLESCIDYYGKYNNHYFGLPFIFAPQILFYRKDIFENKALKNEFFKKYNIKLRPPRIWQEFNLIAKFFTQKNNPSSPTLYGTAIPGKYPECFAPDAYIRLKAYGSEIYDEKFRIIFQSRNTIKAVKDLTSLIKTSSADYFHHNDLTAVNEFIKGNIAMLISYPSFITNINDLQKSYLTGNVGYAHVPTKTGIFGGWGLGLSAKTANMAEAFQFIRWVCDKEISNYCTIMAGQSAVCSTMQNNELLSLYPWLSLYKEAYQCSEPLFPPVLPGGKVVPQEKIDKIVYNVFYRVLNDSMTAEESVEKAHLELVNLFDKYSYKSYEF